MNNENVVCKKCKSQNLEPIIIPVPHNEAGVGKIGLSIAMQFASRMLDVKQRREVSKKEFKKLAHRIRRAANQRPMKIKYIHAIINNQSWEIDRRIALDLIKKRIEDPAITWVTDIKSAVKEYVPGNSFNITPKHYKGQKIKF